MVHAILGSYIKVTNKELGKNHTPQVGSLLNCFKLLPAVWCSVASLRSAAAAAAAPRIYEELPLAMLLYSLYKYTVYRNIPKIMKYSVVRMHMAQQRGKRK